jgi:hypothetical protein
MKRFLYATLLADLHSGVKALPDQAPSGRSYTNPEISSA